MGNRKLTSVQLFHRIQALAVGQDPRLVASACLTQLALSVDEESRSDPSFRYQSLSALKKVADGLLASDSGAPVAVKHSELQKIGLNGLTKATQEMLRQHVKDLRRVSAQEQVLMEAASNGTAATKSEGSSQ